METLAEAKRRRARWVVPRGKGFPQCYYCGRLSQSHTRLEPGRRVPTCDHDHRDLRRDGKEETAQDKN